MSWNKHEAVSICCATHIITVRVTALAPSLQLRAGGLKIDGADAKTSALS
jgi:hypothetical protein